MLFYCQLIAGLTWSETDPKHNFLKYVLAFETLLYILKLIYISKPNKFTFFSAKISIHLEYWE